MPMTTIDVSKFPYPRRRFIRGLIRPILAAAFGTLSDFKIEGAENLPDHGPLLVAANHFSFVDPPVVIRALPWPLDFVGGFQMPNAPAVVTFLPSVWGYYPVFRGRSSRNALVAAQAVMAQEGVLGIFPEGGSWATVLRPPRPGVAFLQPAPGRASCPLAWMAAISCSRDCEKAGAGGSPCALASRLARLSLAAALARTAAQSMNLGMN
jgi:1-acyl-sn-glycerol-3-phosphate acyltransferase